MITQNEKKIITEIDNILDSLKGSSIKKCLRLFSENEYENIPEDKKEEESDGKTYFIFSNNDIIGFYPNSENFTIQAEKLSNNELPDRVSDVSENQFWKNKINKKITGIKLLYNTLDFPFGLRFYLENDLKVELHYISESDYTFDALIIK